MQDDLRGKFDFVDHINIKVLELLVELINQRLIKVINYMDQVHAGKKAHKHSINSIIHEIN